MSFKNTPFFVGGRFEDRTQSYEVLNMSDAEMTVRFDDGTVKTFGASSIEIRARIHQNMQLEAKASHLSSGDQYYWTLGYLSARGRFDAEVPPDIAENFMRRYRELSGVSVSPPHPGLIILRGTGNKWAAELRVYFPVTTAQLDFGPAVQIRSTPDPNTQRFNNNDAWQKLVKMGFRLGVDHDLGRIRSFIPNEKLSVFEAGQSGNTTTV